ncbi:MAG: NUDIX domain-containing protein [Anaerolineae bacterium]|nr:MAG: NUDIX domain-containing protein [Anaerolineae bacterium]
MGDTTVPDWLNWARRIQAIAQSGRMYALNEFQTVRYEQLSALAAEIVAVHADLKEEGVQLNFLEQNGYATPKVDVRAAVFDNRGRLLMVQERSDGTWSMPGGWADVGDIPSEAAERETLEEAGLRVKAKQVVGVYDANRVPTAMHLYHAYKLVFLCEILDGKVTDSNETSAVEFFQRDAIPENQLGNRTSSRQIEDAFALLTDPNRPTQFD